MMDKLDVGDVVSFGETGEIGIVISLSPSPSRTYGLCAEIKWIGGDGETTHECPYKPADIHVVARASGS
tara:strand:+ start:606 stop:812 length:207 start_codon:yes stop_codon:yes gene_type:complete